jgi:hypothetical protein
MFPGMMRSEWRRRDTGLLAIGLSHRTSLENVERGGQ